MVRREDGDFKLNDKEKYDANEFEWKCWELVGKSKIFKKNIVLLYEFPDGSWEPYIKFDFQFDRNDKIESRKIIKELRKCLDIIEERMELNEGDKEEQKILERLLSIKIKHTIRMEGLYGKKEEEI